MELRHLREICGVSPSIFRFQSLFPMEKLQKIQQKRLKSLPKKLGSNLAIGIDEKTLGTRLVKIGPRTVGHFDVRHIFDPSMIILCCFLRQ